MSAAIFGVLAEVLASNERILERLEKLERTVVDEHHRVEAICDLAISRQEERDGLHVVT